MKKQQGPTPDAGLERKHRLCWWWRSIDPQEIHEDVIRQLGYHSGYPHVFPLYERSAFLYELHARLSGKFEYEKPWSLIGTAKQDILSARWPPDGRYSFVCINTLADNPPVGFSDFMGKLCFNLRLSNDTLAKAFLDWIERERRRLSMPNPKPNKGLKRRGISWRPIELLDIQRLKLRVLTDAERSQISKVKKRFKRVFNSASS